jgi:undecaprenyl diphosphate synthase
MKIPKHIALIPDGNRRWAKEKGLKPWDGHDAGIAKFEEFTEWCYGLGVKEITAYSISKENLEKRNSLEVRFLLAVYARRLVDLLNSDRLAKREVRVEFIGDLTPFPTKIKKLIADVHKKTAKHKKRVLRLCINYSGRDEILRAANSLRKSKMPIDEKSFEAALQVKSAPDLLIRTAEKRISNFLLWQCAYSEIYFSQKMFPDFSKVDLEDAIRQYNNTERKYGK